MRTDVIQLFPPAELLLAGHPGIRRPLGQIRLHLLSYVNSLHVPAHNEASTGALVDMLLGIDPRDGCIVLSIATASTSPKTTLTFADPAACVHVL